MELVKTDILSIALLHAPLSSNFAIIEECFKNLLLEVDALKSNQQHQIIKLIELARTVQDLKEQPKPLPLSQRRPQSSFKQNSRRVEQPYSSKHWQLAEPVPSHQMHTAQQSRKEQLDNRVSVSREEGTVPKVPLSRQEKKISQAINGDFEDKIVKFKKQMLVSGGELQDKISKIENENANIRDQVAELFELNSYLSRAIGLSNSKVKTDRRANRSSIKAATAPSEGQNSKQAAGSSSCEKQGVEQWSPESAVTVLQREVDKLRDSTNKKLQFVEEWLLDSQLKMQSAQQSLELLERANQACKFDTSYQRPIASFKKNAQKNKEESGDQRELKCMKDGSGLPTLLKQMEDFKAQVMGLLNQSEQEQVNMSLTSPSFTGGEKSQQKNVEQTKKCSPLGNEVLNCKRDLARLRHEFDELMRGVNAGSHEIKTYIIKPNETKEDWKSLSTKIYKTKMELQASVRDLEGRLLADADMGTLVTQLERGLDECKTLINKRVETIDFEKAHKKLESRLNNFIMQVFQKEGHHSDHEAMLAKQAWFCLSCDSELGKLTGKVERVVGERAIGKKLNTQLHMVRRKENGRFPSVVK